jgi:hypothetical protein
MAVSGTRQGPVKSRAILMARIYAATKHSLHRIDARFGSLDEETNGSFAAISKNLGKAFFFTGIQRVHSSVLACSPKPLLGKLFLKTAFLTRPPHCWMVINKQPFDLLFILYNVRGSVTRLSSEIKHRSWTLVLPSFRRHVACILNERRTTDSSGTTTVPSRSRKWQLPSDSGLFAM